MKRTCFQNLPLYPCKAKENVKCPSLNTTTWWHCECESNAMVIEHMCMRRLVGCVQMFWGVAGRA